MQKHRPRHRRGALADRPLIAALRSRDRRGRARGQRLREHHRDQASGARERFLARASRVLSSSMDYTQTLRRVAGLAVPRDRRLVRHRSRSARTEISNASRYITPIRGRWRWPSACTAPRPASTAGVAEVIRLGRGAHLQRNRSAGARQPRARPGAPGAPPGDRRLGGDDRPAVGAGETIGAITLVSAESRRRFAEADAGARRTPRPPRRHCRRERPAVHRAGEHRPHPPTGPPPGVAARAFREP